MKPWVGGPLELLRHAYQQLSLGTDFGYRISMICIDNSVELLLKTFLGLPRRVTGLNVGRQKLRDASESFPRLLDLFEENCPDKLIGVDLGDIEFYHRLRNQLYHDGNGVTVERAKVENYAEIARILCQSLFDIDPYAETKREVTEDLEAQVLHLWAKIEQNLVRIAFGKDAHGFSIYRNRNALRKILTPAELQNVEEIRDLRNQIAHGFRQLPHEELEPKVRAMKDLYKRLAQRPDGKPENDVNQP